MSSAMLMERSSAGDGTFGQSSAPGALPTSANWCVLPRCTFKCEKTKDGFKLWCKCDDDVACTLDDCDGGCAPTPVANADGALKPGQFVRVIVEGGSLPDAITVPQSAVQDGTTGKFVYVATLGDKGMTVALPRPVVVGAWTGGDPDQSNGRWVIRQGLKAGDRVIVDGMARIFFPGMPVAASEAGAAPAKPAAPPAQAAAQSAQPAK